MARTMGPNLRNRGKRTLGLVALAGAVALIAGMVAVVVVARTSPDRVPDRLRRLGDTGIAVPVPEGWVDHHRARSGRLLLEVEDRPIAGLLPTRGMWVHR